MLRLNNRLYILICALLFASAVKAQTVTDSAGNKVTAAPAKERSRYDSLSALFVPRKAAIRSAVIPGWGQAYNKKYWKIPLVYAALGTTAGVFVYNVKTYRDLKFAVLAKTKAAYPKKDSTIPNQQGPFQDSTDFFKIKPRYQPVGLESLRTARNDFRRNVDYSVLVFLAFWGLQVIDATVDAHLKSFDVSPNLSLKFRAGYNDVAKNAGFGLVLQFK